jgi:hypothetical protein
VAEDGDTGNRLWEKIARPSILILTLFQEVDRVLNFDASLPEEISEDLFRVVRSLSLTDDI